jgi:hypothetical protein
VDAFKEGDEVRLMTESGQIEVGGQVFSFPRLPQEILAIREAGGLLPYTREVLRRSS